LTRFRRSGTIRLGQVVAAQGGPRSFLFIFQSQNKCEAREFCSPGFILSGLRPRRDGDSLFFLYSRGAFRYRLAGQTAPINPQANGGGSFEWIRKEAGENPIAAAMTNEKKPPAASTAKRTGTSYAITVKVLGRIDQLSLDTTPQFYELWYRYFGGDPDIVRAIDSHQGTLDELACQTIYNQYLSTSAHDAAVRKVSDQVQHSITGLGAILKSVTSATSEYGESLSDVTEKIQKAESIEDLGAVMSGILEETREMVGKNREMEGQLVNSSKEVSQLKQYMEIAKKEATTDGLTGIANRRAFDRQISDGIEEAAATRKPLVLMMLDIDHFKKFNDTYGHPVGDQVLRLVARTLVNNVKGQDTAARYGGEEFAIILPGTPLESGLRVAETLRHAVASKDITNKSTSERLGSITLSIGVTEYREGDGVASLIERADAALYEAKKTGRNRVCVAGRAGA
jgi:diguanylate cyclase